MELLNGKQIQEWKEKHKTHNVKTELTLDNKNTVTITCIDCIDVALASIPYRMFCIHPFKCAGCSSCPRNYSCCE